MLINSGFRTIVLHRSSYKSFTWTDETITAYLVVFSAQLFIQVEGENTCENQKIPGKGEKMIKSISKTCKQFMMLVLSLTLCAGLVCAGTYQVNAQEADSVNTGFGSANVQLEEGDYDIPVSLMKASNIEEKSAAAGCVKDAVLSVKEDGSAELTVNLQTIEMFGAIAGSKDWKIYNTIGSEDDWTNRDKSNPQTVEAEVIETETYTGSDSKEYTVDTVIKFTIPDNSWDGIYVSIFVELMNSAPDAYLQLDYANAVKQGEDRIEVYNGIYQVEQFGKYNVCTEVTVKDGKISALEIYGTDFGGSFEEENILRMNRAIRGLKDKLLGLSADKNDGKIIYDAVRADAVSGATVSSDAIGESVMNALGMQYNAEVINVPESIAPGIYEVPVTFYTDMVTHNLTEAKTKGSLTVQEDGSMQLEFDTLTGNKEPLYLLDVKGYYENNDTKGKLVNNNFTQNKVKSDYEDEYFVKGTEVVEHVSLPLTGGLSKEYAALAYLYVPAMNNLNGEVSGMIFEHGYFEVNTLAKIYWDEIEKTGDIKSDEDIEKITPQVVKGNIYTVSGQSYKVTKAAKEGTQGTVTLTRAKNAKSVTVPNAVKLADGNTYKVTQAAAKAFTAKKIRTVTVGRNVKKLFADAFKGSKATKVILKTGNLKKSGIRKCLKGSKVKTIQVKVGTKKQNKKYVKAYKKIFTKKIAGKKAQVTL